ncbi:MAG: hypothetical protein Q8867_09860 [Bacteroidota bacterium]|nr:hypothetical protein [Bacteroidota bacterium]
MTKFITVTLAKGSEEGQKEDIPILLNSHYIIKIADAADDDLGKTSIALATGEFLFVTETRQEIHNQLI